MKILLGAVAIAIAVAALAPPTPATATANEATHYVTGVVSTDQEAALLPCDGVVAHCFPKPATPTTTPARWHIDQGRDDCWLRSDVTTGFRMMGTCVLDVDMGDHVKVWAPPGAVVEDFRLIWEG